MDRDFMLLAIREAKKSAEPLKCGAVIVKNGKVIAQSFNAQRADNDASAHAEINAIRLAGKKLGNKNLNGCSIYCTCEPCVMCLTAIAFAKIDKLIYGLSLKDISPSHNLIDISIDDFLAQSPYKFQVTKNFMEAECKQLI